MNQPGSRCVADCDASGRHPPAAAVNRLSLDRMPTPPSVLFRPDRSAATSVLPGADSSYKGAVVVRRKSQEEGDEGAVFFAALFAVAVFLAVEAFLAGALFLAAAR